ncbi:MAG: ABC transporter substrate-binding protein, partial [Chloroflexi bacterium]|nr:ABC transporter substrate-binding protein [Chloroflexota bacterium]
MKRLAFILSVVLLVASLLLMACAKPAPSPAPAPKPTGTATPTAAPKASPTAVAPAPAATPQYGGIYRRTHTVPPRSWIPPENPAPMAEADAMFNYLLVTDEKGEKLYPQLATDWKLSPDATSLTLTLRKGVKFHDGTELNAAAVKWNMEKRKAAKLGDYEEVTSIVILDDYTVKLNLSAFKNTSLVSLWFTGGQMFSPTAYEKMGKDWAMFNPVGTGPFKFVSYERDQLLKMVRFDGYWEKGKPYLDGYYNYYFADITTLVLAFLKGDVDFVGN